MPQLTDVIDRFLRRVTEESDKPTIRALIDAEEVGAADTAQAAAIDAAAADATSKADAKVSDTAYDATTWDGVTTVAPSKNAVRDVIAPIKTAVEAATANVAPSTIVKRNDEGGGNFHVLTIFYGGTDYGLYIEDETNALRGPLAASSNGTLSFGTNIIAYTESFSGFPDRVIFGEDDTAVELSVNQINFGATARTAFLAALGIPTYADLEAANAVLSLGQIYFDTALGTLNTATA